MLPARYGLGGDASGGCGVGVVDEVWVVAVVQVVVVVMGVIILDDVVDLVQIEYVLLWGFDLGVAVGCGVGNGYGVTGACSEGW